MELKRFAIYDITKDDKPAYRSSYEFIVLPHVGDTIRVVGRHGIDVLRVLAIVHKPVPTEGSDVILDLARATGASVTLYVKHMATDYPGDDEPDPLLGVHL